MHRAAHERVVGSGIVPHALPQPSCSAGEIAQLQRRDTPHSHVACAEVANGFHRYFASLILGFAELPVELPRSSALLAKRAPASSSAPAKWVPPSVRKRMEERALWCVRRRRSEGVWRSGDHNSHESGGGGGGGSGEAGWQGRFLDSDGSWVGSGGLPGCPSVDSASRRDL